MPSPFPGMNPYLEKSDLWSDFHNRFIAALAEALTGPLSPRYYVKIEEYLYIHDLPAEERQYFGRSDLSVHPVGGPAPAVAAALTVPAPSIIGLPPAVDVERVPFLEIRDRTSQSVVTVLELLSPSNKYAGPDRDQYVTKQTRLLRSMTNLVEIDLLRGGPRLPWSEMPACDYYALVSRATDRSRVSFWPIRLRDPLPVIPIPLRPGEPEPTVDLQAILHRVYDAAGYALYIYARLPEPQLATADAAWAAKLVPPTATAPG
ncbi:MAG TPA: DUF4058 family protein [Fimbriiglobus sp.]|nr:DUF4058 family protein [Fimbriiglobus sp.]